MTKPNPIVNPHTNAPVSPAVFTPTKNVPEMMISMVNFALYDKKDNGFTENAPKNC